MNIKYFRRDTYFEAMQISGFNSKFLPRLLALISGSCLQKLLLWYSNDGFLWLLYLFVLFIGIFNKKLSFRFIYACIYSITFLLQYGATDISCFGLESNGVIIYWFFFEIDLDQSFWSSFILAPLVPLT